MKDLTRFFIRKKASNSRLVIFEGKNTKGCPKQTFRNFEVLVKIQSRCWVSNFQAVCQCNHHSIQDKYSGQNNRNSCRNMRQIIRAEKKIYNKSIDPKL